MHENWWEKLIISSDSEYVSNIITLPSIICANMRSGSCKISSRYFSKMLLIPRYRNYRPIPNQYRAYKHSNSLTTEYLVKACTFFFFISYAKFTLIRCSVSEVFLRMSIKADKFVGWKFTKYHCLGILKCSLLISLFHKCNAGLPFTLLILEGPIRLVLLSCN